jgi:hypothetical protein
VLSYLVSKVLAKSLSLHHHFHLIQVGQTLSEAYTPPLVSLWPQPMAPFPPVCTPVHAPACAPPFTMCAGWGHPHPSSAWGESTILLLHANRECRVMCKGTSPPSLSPHPCSLEQDSRCRTPLWAPPLFMHGLYTLFTGLRVCTAQPLVSCSFT